MPDNQDKLQQRFEQLPDAEPPFGLDTRIQAQARAQLDEQRSSRSQSKRWRAGLATVACAGLAFVIAKPLLQTPSSQRIELDSAIHTESFASDTMELSESISPAIAPMPASAPQPATQKSSSARRISNGGGARPERLAEPAPQAEPQLMKRSIAAPAASLETIEESANMVQAMELAKEQVPELQALLMLLEKHRVDQEQEKADDIEALIKEHYPEHELK